MRRATLVAALSLMLVAVVGTAVSASGHTGTATFAAQAGTAATGGTLSVGATVKNAVAGTAFSATAVVHFKTGDVKIQLEPPAAVTPQRADHRGEHHRHHRHHGQQQGVDLTATADVPVVGEEPWGPVPVDVTITYGDQIVTVSATGLIDGY